MTASAVSCLTLNRLSLYLRCLRALQERGTQRVSSMELAREFDLSAPQIRKDLAQFGEFGIRGVGYDVEQLVARLRGLLGLDRPHNLLVVGLGHLGSAVARHFASNHRAFHVVGLFDNAPEKIGQPLEGLRVRPVDELVEAVAETEAEIGVLAVPAPVAQEVYDRLVEAGIASILNFAPVQLRQSPGVRCRTVDLRIYLEELVYFLEAEGSPAGEASGTAS